MESIMQSINKWIYQSKLFVGNNFRKDKWTWKNYKEREDD
jgi:hypothetical protein